MVRRRREDKPRAYRASKFYSYASALPLAEIQTILLEKGAIERKERDLDLRRIKTVSSKISDISVIDNVGLFGTIYYQIQKPTGRGDHYWTIRTLDFLICSEPSVLILHGSRQLMTDVVPQLERAIHNIPETDDETPRDPFFIPYSFERSDGKYIVRKIVKRMEAFNERNILYEPHFEKLRENTQIRGGQSFHRRDGKSAILDNEFCYYFDLCTFWTPELSIYSCGGITCPQITEPITVKINSDFSFGFSHDIPKQNLDTFWNSLILPIILEDDYSEEQTECVEKAREFAERTASFR